jgi:hypothetical protein
LFLQNHMPWQEYFIFVIYILDFIKGATRRKAGRPWYHHLCEFLVPPFFSDSSLGVCGGLLRGLDAEGGLFQRLIQLLAIVSQFSGIFRNFAGRFSLGENDHKLPPRCRINANPYTKRKLFSRRTSSAYLFIRICWSLKNALSLSNFYAQFPSIARTEIAGGTCSRREHAVGGRPLTPITMRYTVTLGPKRHGHGFEIMDGWELMPTGTRKNVLSVFCAKSSIFEDLVLWNDFSPNKLQYVAVLKIIVRQQNRRHRVELEHLLLKPPRIPYSTSMPNKI